MKKNCVKISLVCNILIFIMTIGAAIIMFTGFKFMEGDLILEVSRFGMLKFFTVQSNLFMGVIALVFACKEIEFLKGKIDDISSKLFVLKLMSTVAVSITFLTVVCYLSQIVNGGIGVLLKNSNLFFHLIIPVVSILTFILFERTNKLKAKDAFWGIIPVALYAVFYLINVLVHLEGGKVSPTYDWYWFVQGGLHQALFVLPLMLFGTYITSLVIWFLNHKRK